MKTFKKISLVGAFAFICVIWAGLYNQPGNKKGIRITGDGESITAIPVFHATKSDIHSKYKKHISFYSDNTN